VIVRIEKTITFFIKQYQLFLEDEYSPHYQTVMSIVRRSLPDAAPDFYLPISQNKKANPDATHLYHHIDPMLDVTTIFHKTDF